VNNTTVGEPSHASTPLHMACKSNHPEVADFLVNVAHADIEFPDDDGVPPVFYSRPNVAILKCMLSLGANIHKFVGPLQLNLSERLVENYLIWNTDTGTISDAETIEAFKWCSAHNIVQRRAKIIELRNYRYYNTDIIGPYARLIECGAIETSIAPALLKQIMEQDD
jgi:hypothetical protein